MNTQTPAQALGEALDLSQKATPGPWHAIIRGSYGFEPEADVNGMNGESLDGAEFVAPMRGESDTIRGQMYQWDARLIAAAVNLIRQHGQYFAGLVEENERLRGDLSAQCLATNQQSQSVLEHVAYGEKQWHRAEAAEARCAELMEIEATLENAAQSMTDMSRRLREAEGLLRHWQAWICGPSELHKATATFLAASGESK